MVNKIQIRRGTNAEREAVILDSGELGWTTDTKDLYIGDGETLGGNLVTGVKAATFIVAASDSLHKERADYVCDGVDDQVEIQAAIDALDDAIGGQITFLEGTYDINECIILQDKNNVVLQGYGAKWYAHDYLNILAGDMGMLHLIGCTNCRVTGFEFDGNKDNQDAETHLLHIKTGCHNIKLDNNHFHHMYGDGCEICGSAIQDIQIVDNVAHDGFEHCFHIGAGTRIVIARNIMYNDACAGVEMAECGETVTSDVLITDNVIYNTKYGIQIFPSWVSVQTIEDVIISNNEIYGHSNDGIRIGGATGTLEDLEIKNNNIYDSAVGIDLIPATDGPVKKVVISNNEIYGHTANGIDVAGTANMLEDLIIRNNGVHSNGAHGINIASNHANEITVQENDVRNNTNTGIHITAVGTKVQGNRVSDNDCTTHIGGIYIEADNVVVKDNQVFNNQKDGINIEEGSEYNIIEGNYIYNNSQDGDGSRNGVACYLTADATNRRNKIIGNTIISGDNNRHGYGIRLYGSSGHLFDGWVIKDNYIEKFKIKGIISATVRNLMMWEQYYDLFMDCLAASTTHIHAAISGTGAEQTISVTNQSDVSRNLSALYAKSNGAEPGGVVRIKGIDAKGETIYDLTERALKGAVADDGGSLTDETMGANNATANDMTLLPATLEVGDAHDFGGEFPFGKLALNVGTLGAGNYTITWKYWNGSAWANLSDVDDETDMFKRPGIRKVTFTIPGDWAASTIETVEAYWIRAEVTAYTANGYIQPLGTQAWIIDNQEGEAFWFTGIGTLYGKYAFAKVNSLGLIIPAAFTATENVAFGISDKLGFSNLVTESADVYKVKKNNADVTVGTVDEDNDTVDCATITGGDDFTIYYKSNLNTIKA